MVFVISSPVLKIIFVLKLESLCIFQCFLLKQLFYDKIIITGRSTVKNYGNSLGTLYFKLHIQCAAPLYSLV